MGAHSRDRSRVRGSGGPLSMPRLVPSTTGKPAEFAAILFHIKREQFKLAWEPRGDWPSDLVAEICENFELFHCIDPFQVNPTGVRAAYWRLHGKGSYSYQYSDDDLEELLQVSQTCLTTGDGPQYVLFNNIWMKGDALRFQQLVRSK